MEYAEVTNWAKTADALKIVISLDNQKLTVYRGMEAISSTRVSTGKSGHRTPTGIFSILQKRRWHRSNIYSNAPMPYLQRLTWSGIALHKGHVPNHPASHGCIRMPEKFARQLFSMTDLGAQVFIAAGETKPKAISHEKLLQPRPLHLVTMNERDVMLRWAQDQGQPLKWIPLPVKSPELQEVSYSAVNTSAPTESEPTKTIESAGSDADAMRRWSSLKLADFEYDLAQMEFYQNRSVEPLRVLITQREGAQLIRDVQRLLEELGHEPGDVDGYLGSETRQAIRSFEKAHGLKTTGEISDDLVQLIYEEATSGPAPTGHIYVKQDRKNIFDVPVTIADPDKPLGTHLFNVDNFGADASHANWQVISSDGENNAAAALERITLPVNVRERLERMLTPGSSIIISDGGLSSETNKFTDFVVVN
ncbi:MAG: L,D-transpeptidase family protein [Hyphomicrobiales bacterium]|nr:L,D-transpeptidase family protein [Hyphomicrobiales bacterium]